MIKFELSGNSYKANLHCHTTISDGYYSPEEIKKMYMEKGYSIVAFTDHDVLIDHSDMCENGFLALNGYELEVNESGVRFPKTAHMCFIAKKQDNLTQVCYNEKYLFGNSRNQTDKIKFDRNDYNRRYSHEGVTEMMKMGREAGFFVTYNHPTWSMESYPEYSGYSGMNAMEIFNTGCERSGFNEYNCHAYDDLLRQGKRIFCIAADDNHNHPNSFPINTPLSDSFGGWVVVKCGRLDYESVTDALERGSFYASTGPEIKEFCVEDNTVHVKTSPAHRINYITGIRRTARAAAFYGEGVTEAEFKISPDDGYFRIDVIDDHGCHANTNAIFTDTIFN